MRLLPYLATVVILSCQGSAKEKIAKAPIDTANKTFDTSALKNASVVKKEVIEYTCPGEQAVTTSLQGKTGNKWHVLNDHEAAWMKDAFDYFIVPKRKTLPDYPYITYGDYNGDGKQDTAALVANEDQTKYQLAILTGGNKIAFWDEDILADAALESLPVGAVVETPFGESTKKIKMKSQSIQVEYYERASFVLYLDHSKWKRLQTGD